MRGGAEAAEANRPHPNPLPATGRSEERPSFDGLGRGEGESLSFAGPAHGPG